MPNLWPLKTVPDQTTTNGAVVLATVDHLDLRDRPALMVAMGLPASQANLALRVTKERQIHRCSTDILNCARAKHQPVILVRQETAVQMDLLVTRVHREPMANLATKDLVDLPVKTASPATPAKKDPLANLAKLLLYPALRDCQATQDDLVRTDHQANLETQEKTANPDLLEIQANQANLVARASLDLPVRTEMQENLAILAAAHTAHRLVWRLAISCIILCNFEIKKHAMIKI